MYVCEELAVLTAKPWNITKVNKFCQIFQSVAYDVEQECWNLVFFIVNFTRPIKKTTGPFFNWGLHTADLYSNE